MAWDPYGTLIVMGCKTLTQRYLSAGVWKTRKTTYERLTWRGLDEASAREKQATLAADPNYSDADAVRADDSGQWHVTALKTTIGAWKNES